MLAARLARLDATALASYAEPAAADSDAQIYTGRDSDDADLRTGLFALLNRTDVSIVAAPGRVSGVIRETS